MAGNRFYQAALFLSKVYFPTNTRHLLFIITITKIITVFDTILLTIKFENFCAVVKCKNIVIYLRERVWLRILIRCIIISKIVSNLFLYYCISLKKL